MSCTEAPLMVTGCYNEDYVNACKSALKNLTRSHEEHVEKTLRLRVDF